MTQKQYARLMGLVFLIIALVQVLRLLFGWSVTIGGWSVPVWFSWIALPISGYLSYEGLRNSK